MHNSKVIANRFLNLARNRNETLTPMQLLKLVYIAHGWMLGLYNRPLICDEIQAWQYGPVIPELYDAIRKHRSNPVEYPIPMQDEDLDPREDDIISQIYDIYGRYSGPQLSRMTHAKGSPWDFAYRHGEFGCVISNDLIQDYYKMKAKASKNS